MVEQQEIVQSAQAAIEMPKRSAIEVLEDVRAAVPQFIRILAALLQESIAELVSPLLMLGLILSMSNFLLHGVIFQIAWIPTLWAVTQSVGVDANMGIMIIRAVRNFQRGEVTKGFIYLAVSLALLFVAAIITDVEAVQGVLNSSLDSVFSGLHIPIEALTGVRSVAIVALVATYQLESESLRWWNKGEKKPKAPKDKKKPDPEPDPTTPKREPLSLVRSEQDTEKLDAIRIDGMQPETPSWSAEQGTKLQAAYHRMVGQNKEISGNGLAREAGVRRQVAAAWLEAQKEAIEA